MKFLQNAPKYWKDMWEAASNEFCLLIQNSDSQPQSFQFHDKDMMHLVGDELHYAPSKELQDAAFFGAQAVSLCSVLGAEVWDNQSLDVLSSIFSVVPAKGKEKENYVRRHIVAMQKYSSFRQE